MSLLFIPACILVLFQSVLTTRIIDRLEDYYYSGESVLLKEDLLWFEGGLTYFAGYGWFFMSLFNSYFGPYICPNCGEVTYIQPWITFSIQFLMFINTYNYGKPLGYLLTGLYILGIYLIQVPAFFVDDLIQGKLKDKYCKTKNIVKKSLTLLNITIIDD